MKPIDCTGSAFRGLVNPYTGEPMKVKMVVRTGAEPLFFAPDTYDTAKRQPSSSAALDRWSRVDGIAGLRNSVPPKCAYTGGTLTFASDSDGAWFKGGFNPSHLHTRDEFLYKATMRDGKPSRPAPSSVRATPVAEDVKVKSHAKDVSQAAIDLAGESVSKARKAQRK